jgi:dTDP-4-dehydrorhamnose 3,5-epimerase
MPGATPDEPTVDAAGRRLVNGIEGVAYGRAVSHVDHRGSLAEAVNFDDDFWDEPVVYSYLLTIRPGRVKGWGMHREQAACARARSASAHDLQPIQGLAA